MIKSIPGDHDLLVRIDEQVKALRTDFTGERTAAISRGIDYQNEMKEIRRDVESLRMTRVQLYAIAATLSAIISAVFKVFWR